MGLEVNRAVAQFFVGQVLDGKYHLKRVLGAGSFGFVLQADLILSEALVASVAVKVVPETGVMLAKLDELKAAVHLSHPSLVRCLSVGEDWLSICRPDLHVLFLVMELAQETLSMRLRRALLESEEARQLGLEMAQALELLCNQRVVCIETSNHPISFDTIRNGSWRTWAFFGNRWKEGRLKRGQLERCSTCRRKLTTALSRHPGMCGRSE